MKRKRPARVHTMDAWNSNVAVALGLCFSGNVAHTGVSGLAFPAQRKMGTFVSSRESYGHCSSLSALRVSMVSNDKGNPGDIDNGDKDADSGATGTTGSFLDEFDDNIAWDSIDIEDLDDFFDKIEYPGDEFVDLDDPGELLDFDKETLLEILGLEDDGETITISDDGGDPEPEQFADWDRLISDQVDKQTKSGIDRGIEDLERALMRGVVPADAGVGSGTLPADYGFDPLEISTKDYFKQVQNFILNFLPATKNTEEEPEAGAAMPTAGFVGEEDRPPALILRDYREAEIRHGRLAMLAAVVWPLQEIFDRIFIPDSFGSFTVVYGGTTLPFLPLLMTFFMLNLGYLDIYSSEIKENESGDAFLPGECFWDPLCILEGAPDSMKRNMQEREILNGRAAMIAVAAYIFEEAMTHRPIVSIPTNALLFEPAYQVPYIQTWLDCVAVGQCYDLSV